MEAGKEDRPFGSWGGTCNGHERFELKSHEQAQARA